jgi:hypothetical protein
MSDGRHTDRGESFWRKHIYSGVSDSSKRVCIWDKSTDTKVMDITIPNQVNQFYSTYKDYEKFRIKIENI